MSVRYYVVCRIAPPSGAAGWLGRVLRGQAVADLIDGSASWDGLGIGGISVSAVDAVDWQRRSVDFGAAPAWSPAAVLRFEGSASRNLELWQLMVEYLLPLLADETRGALLFEDGEPLHSWSDRGPSWASRLPALIARAGAGDATALAAALTAGHAHLAPFEQIETVEAILAAPGDVVALARGLLALLQLDPELCSLLDEEGVDAAPLLCRARPDAPAELRLRIDARLDELAEQRLELEVAAASAATPPSRADLPAVLRDYVAGSPRAVAIVGQWSRRFDWRAAAAAPAAREERDALGRAIIEAMARADRPARARLLDAALALSYDEGLGALRDTLLDVPDAAPLRALEEAAAQRVRERAALREANDWSEL
jgi:hypothetical protein